MTGVGHDRSVPEITVFTKSKGPLTKSIKLGKDGAVVSDGSACTMAHGQARRMQIADVGVLAKLIEGLHSNQALALGTLRPGLSDEVGIVTKDELNGETRPDIIARTGSDILYRKGSPAFALLDYDTKGMPGEVADRLDTLGGFRSALIAVLPTLRDTALVIRRSTSAGLVRTDTGEQLPGSNGQHGYVPVRDGTDIERFLKTLHERCWLHGLGWMMVGVAGQLLERSIVDRMVGAPERLVFEAPPILAPPLSQDQASRRPTISAGDMLDTIADCPPLTLVEQQALRKLRAEASQRLASEQSRAREAFISHQTQRLVERTGLSEDEASRVVECQSRGILLPDIELSFTDPELEGSTVGDILANPDRFDGCTLADPIEGVEYGRSTAKVMRRSDGAPWINSFAHGRTVYELKYDFRAVRAQIEQASDPVGTLVKLALTANLDEVEIKSLMDDVAKRSGTGIRPLTAKLKAARKQHAGQRAKENAERRLAERQDPRPQIPSPAADAPWLPMMDVLNAVLGESRDIRPPTRDIDNAAAQMRILQVADMHVFTSANEGETDNAPKQPANRWAIHRMNEMELAELIEKHIDFVDKDGNSVHLPMQFVRHYLQRNDSALSKLLAGSMLPLVLADGGVLATNGLDRTRGIEFYIPEELIRALPQREACTPAAMKQAIEFLTDDWLVDVLAAYAGKCTLIALALTVIERAFLPERPVFFVTAGKRGGGKSTALKMILLASTGMPVGAAAWSTNEEERRKSLLSYLVRGESYILWDNIPRGAQITCPHIERACTTSHYSDRKLGVSETVTAPATSIHAFTGNNIGPCGDLASRTLQVRIEVDRVDPENRVFKHPDPIAWTNHHRSEILQALYTILLGNPTLDKPHDAAMNTRFKMWYRLIGSAVEHAAKQAGNKIDFQALFQSQEAEDEDSVSLAEVLDVMHDTWTTKTSNTFKAANVADYMNSDQSQHRDTLRAFFCPTLETDKKASPKSVGKKLSQHVGEPVRSGDRTLILKVVRDPSTGPRGAVEYKVEVK